MSHIIIIADLNQTNKQAYDLGVGIIKVFTNLKKAYNYIYTESEETYTKVSYSSIAGYLAKGNQRYYSLDGRLGILKFRVE